MWFYRGAQSAVFYYATCTPCAMSVDRRKRKKDAARVKREKQLESQVICDQPRPFPQPTAFSTNEGWRQEIALGPGPPTRRGGNRSHQRTNSWKSDDMLNTKEEKSSKHSFAGMRYQREDEILWGQEVAGSSIGFSGRGRTDKYEQSKYYAPNVPPVQDPTPPILCGPRSRAETRWMLQPPPSAKVMAGKEESVFSPVDNVGGFFPEPRNVQANHRRDEKSLAQITHDISNGNLNDESIEHQLPRPPSNTHERKRSGSFGHEDLDLHRFSQSDSMFSMPNTDDQSFSASWKYPPDTPTTRPVSKETQYERGLGRQHMAQALSIAAKNSKNNVHLLHLEINDDIDDDLSLGELERVRPWRWSMDI
ncbi:hypothetical protein N7495_002545 [Penicillium taxi]|uniref:uncharacterized protein n=1 Tax=Penicillium taxi TaxID=168475 RepID=UPI002544DD39|nr:uncharacterized protein N7495_002545 [Penicillium taxi]KAJ5902017.1 hypothetical protein N7495_002545 [Penicillium taxi]